MSAKNCIWCGSKMPKPKHNGDGSWETVQVCEKCGMTYEKGLGWLDWQGK